VPRQNINDLLAFLAVARERSFTKAAARFGISQSALSHTIRQLESRLGVRLLTRTTRAVAPTEAGERLLERIGPHFDQIEIEVDALNELREKPAGTIRINAPDYAISSVLWPKLKKFLPKYPDVKVELLLDNGLTDIVTERYDAGVRMGNDEDFAAVERAAVEEMTEVRRKAETAPKPEFESIFDHIFATGPAGSTVQRETSA